jgi:energy-converting hydrogenase B subunit D
MTMLVMQAAIMVFVAVGGTAVVLTRDAKCQVIGLSFYGFLLTLMFFLYQAPDVALSQITIGAVALPLMFMLALARVRRDLEQLKREDEEKEKKQGGKPQESAA